MRIKEISKTSFTNGQTNWLKKITVLSIHNEVNQLHTKTTKIKQDISQLNTLIKIQHEYKQQKELQAKHKSSIQEQLKTLKHLKQQKSRLYNKVLETNTQDQQNTGKIVYTLTILKMLTLLTYTKHIHFF